MRRALLSGFLFLAFAAPTAAQPPVASPLTAPPLEVLDQFVAAKLAPVQALAPAERAVLEALWTAHASGEKPPQAGNDAAAAHIVAGGVTDKAAIAKYVKRLDDLTAAAKRATAGAKTDREKADQLLRFLHKGTLSKGFRLEQTCLHTALDSGTFNCVSSAELYYLVGTRLGLELVPVLMPGHAAVDLIDAGERIAIETTCANGFDALEKAKKPGAFVGRQPTRVGATDTDGYGLAASAAGNRGLAAGTASPPRHGDDVRAHLVALTLAPSDPGVQQNLRAAFLNWGVRDAKAGNYESALKTTAFALAAFNEHKDFDNNHRAFWSQYADAEFKVGRYKSGVAVLARAAKAVPAEKSFGDTSVWLARAVGRLADAGKFDDAKKAAEECAALTSNATEVYERVYDAWARDLAKRKQWDAALGKYAEGLAAAKDSKRLRQNAEWATDQWAGDAIRGKDWAGAVRIYEAGLKVVPDSDHLKHNKAVCLERVNK